MNFEQAPLGKREHGVLQTPSLSTPELRSLDENRRKEIIQETAIEIMTALSEAGGFEYEDVGDLYKELSDEQLLVRREDPARLIQSVAKREELPISFPSDSRYSNAVLWEPRLAERGLINAYLEGYGSKNGIVTVVGARPGKQLDIQKMPDAAQQFAGLDREHVYSVEGSVPSEDIVFVIVRTPIEAFPEDLLSEGEADLLFEKKHGGDPGIKADPLFVQRGYLFKKTKTH